jgi:alginate O-acetyltransferase complex protein AlgJ
MQNKLFSPAKWTMTSINRALAALALTVVMVVGVWETIAAVKQIEKADFPTTLTDFREGRTTNALEKLIEQKLPARSGLIAFANSVRFLLTGGGGEQVRVGKSDWLFLTEEMRFDADGSAHLATRADVLGTAARRLDLMGVKLVVALVPDKARVHSDHLKSSHYPEYNRSRYHDAVTAIRARNVTVVDLLEPLAAGAVASDVYYRTDTHWNQLGAKLAADTIAKVVKNLGLTLTPTHFDTLPSGEAVQRPGDLIRLMGLESTPDSVRPRADTEVPMVTKETSTSNAGGLFGDAGVSVVLTGTSYSLRGNFHGFLQQALETKVLNAAKDGGGLLQATTAYLTDESFRSAKPAVLVWEIPERFVLAPLDGEPAWLSKVGLQP